MYLDHLQLKEYPFQLTPDSDFLYPSKVHARAKAYMDYALWNRDGFVVITGEVGAGKTTIIQRFLSELDQNVLVAKIYQTQLTEIEFLQAVLTEFGIRPSSNNKIDILNLLNAFLLESYAQSKQLVLIVDEAQNLSYSVLEEIRMLSGLETRKEKILHVILVGQPELKEKLESPELAQLLQRVRLRFHLRGLMEAETRDYVRHRLRIAGAKTDNIFHDNTFPIIFQYSGGIPRLINTLCDTALTCAYADDQQHVSADVVKAAIDELQWTPFSKKTKAPVARKNSLTVESAQAAQLVRENKQFVASLSEKLDHIDSIGHSLTNMSNRLLALEAQVKRIADHLTTDSGADKVRYLKDINRKPQS